MIRPTAALAAALLLAACADVGDAPIAETSPAQATPTERVALPAGEPVPIDTAASTIEWTAAKVTRTHVGGFHSFEGVLYLDGDRVTGADVTAEAASIYADVDRLTEHLKSDDFFDAAVNPHVRFVVSSLTPIADATDANGATHTAQGQISMHGQTNRVAFPATVTVDAGTVVAEADFIINRQDWGLTYPGQPDDLIRDEVRLRLHIVAPVPPPAATAGAVPAS